MQESFEKAAIHGAIFPFRMAISAGSILTIYISRPKLPN